MGGQAMSLRRTISVVVPAYNEAGNLEGAVATALNACAGFDDFEILIVNDGSTDTTAEVAERLARAIPQVRVIHHPRNQGFAAAYGTGLEHARMDYFSFITGDNENDTEVQRAVFAAVGAADLVIPYIANPERKPWYRRLLTWISTTQLNTLFGWRLRYYQGGTVYPTALARTLPRSTKGFFFITEMLVYAIDAGYTQLEVPLPLRGRDYGQSKAVSLSNMVDAQVAILFLWWNIRVRQRRLAPRGECGAAEAVLEGMQS
jgi:glycosyltransferase involved in cell wall biosynthesis